MSNLHPGEILKKVIEQRNISSAAAAREMGVNIATISRLINKKQSLTADVALKLGPFCGLEPLWLLAQQNIYDIALLSKQQGKDE
ncbi:Uncharacterized HTH-type transcriptional regulator YddM [Citrobacter werkmanii]|uniref:HigA family addiction module antidote protein n=1 Tax=Citrobacter werkmanii TaxID=67827 RepID=A0A9N8CTD4_9ENTR|nr:MULTISPECIES: HigA family addiction module antitoxin [Citrobacter freundii complex]OIY13593.1 addiction module antidote protein, HigA family [Citrobacter freundii]CAB5549919.1 Uncharacterized HTH-type transcriptional regulator YddM [Citrobacter werkmanii]CAB5578014.1 Uncharacterized HTH-type transcriptional regulator YddM [Citrobacter werkmanii]CAB5591599.1 Uncharacterized HTH-type transcriptional regulator YddM [Citrobacter werkmanii]CAB5591723.1 Uncharacterized HTH-type transcriptional re